MFAPSTNHVASNPLRSITRFERAEPIFSRFSAWFFVIAICVGYAPLSSLAKDGHAASLVHAITATAQSKTLCPPVEALARFNIILPSDGVYVCDAPRQIDPLNDLRPNRINGVIKALFHFGPTVTFSFQVKRKYLHFEDVQAAFKKKLGIEAQLHKSNGVDLVLDEWLLEGLPYSRKSYQLNLSDKFQLVFTTADDPAYIDTVTIEDVRMTTHNVM